MKIAILGATGHIAKNLIDNFFLKHDLHLFSRNKYKDIREFYNGEYDAVINCIGYGNPAEVKDVGVALFTVTEHHDNNIIQYLKAEPKTKYIYISSGVVHNPVNVNNYNFYQMSKLNAEAKHRSLPELNIIDIRLYSFFTRYTNLDATFFMSALIKAICDSKPFKTDKSILIRDYINPKDLSTLIELCLKEKKINDAFDIYSLKPVEKMEILDYFQNEYNLKVKFIKKYEGFSSVGKNEYYSVDKKAQEKLGYFPQYSSIQTIKEESKYLLT